MIRFSNLKTFLVSAAIAMIAVSVFGQSRNNARGVGELDGAVLTVTAARTDGSKDPIRVENLSLYENSVEQKIKNFAFDPAPSKIVLLIDNSQTLPTDVEVLKQATMEFAYEIFDGDQLFVIAYDEKPEIIQEWTDDAKKMEASLATFRKEGNPYLFDALMAASREVLAPLMPGTRKVAVVVIGDGLDRGSKSKFSKTLDELQSRNVTVYFLQIPDRTNSAYRRNQPKAREVVKQLTEGTGGLIFPLEDAQTAAKTICDELRNNRYNLSYLPTNTSTYDARKLFILGQDGIKVRTKAAHPPTVK
jgi:Ca-activated chloride channel family protein